MALLLLSVCGGNSVQLELYFPDRVTVGLKPSDRFFQPFPQAMVGFKTEELLGSTHIQTAPRLAVRLGGVPLDVSCEPHFPRNQGR